MVSFLCTPNAATHLNIVTIIFQIPTDSDVSDESSLLRLQQCSLPQFCLLGIGHVLPHIDLQPDAPTLVYKLSCLLCHCVTPQIWVAPASDVVATDIATHLFEMLEKLGEVLLQDRLVALIASVFFWKCFQSQGIFIVVNFYSQVKC